MSVSRRFLVLVAGAIVVLLLFGGRLISLYVDYLWFGSLGFQTVFLTGLWTKLALFFGAGLLFFIFYLANTLAARGASTRLLRRVPSRSIEREERPGLGGLGEILGGRPRGASASGSPWGELSAALGGVDAGRWTIEHATGILAVATGLFLSLIMGLAAASEWETLQRVLHAVPFGVNDPVFSHDIGFYVFTYPALGALQSWLWWAVALSMAAVAALYLLALYVVDPAFEHVWFYLDSRARAMRTHLLILGAVLVALVAVDIWLGGYQVLTARHERMVGADFTDLHARLPATRALAATAMLAALLAVVTAFRRSFSLLIIGGVLFAAVLVIGRGLMPFLVQRLQVDPAELIQERPYLQQNIRFTRQAFGLDSVSEQVFPAEDAVRPEEIRANTQTISNLRLWDPRPLKDTFNQVQSIRPYYTFDDVDVDRYVVDGQYRQVMLSARELSVDRLGQQSQTWVNRQLQYTHGYGLAMSPVNEVSPLREGLPTFYIQDLPPSGRLRVDRPEIYYGEQTPSYVLVNTSTQEFDYPTGDQNAFSTYKSTTSGIQVGPLWRRAALAWYFGDFNLLISSYLNPESRVLFRRQVRDRAQRALPFLKLDHDPYLVLADGKLTWMIDGYTTADQYPYAQLVVERASVGDTDTTASAPAVAPGAGTNSTSASPQTFFRRITYNYIRNSVKITIDAYDGSVTAYVADPDDPVVRTYDQIFPGILRPLSDMPAALRDHVRYPEDLFKVQAQVLRTYHVQDPQVFYNGEDVWGAAVESLGDRRIPVEPYYVIMRLPGESREEFLLMLPFTPASRDNMVAWLAARSDGSNYGRLLLYKYPRDRLIYGPSQIDARMDQDPTISGQLTLWNQQGSRVIRGNLLVIPIGNSTLYVKPLYLQAESSRLPELKRVVVATGNRLAMEPSLDEVLNRLFGADTGATAPPAAPAAPAAPVPSAPGASTVGAVGARAAREAYQRALDALKAGDFARFGDELKALDDRLRELEQTTGPP